MARQVQARAGRTGVHGRCDGPARVQQPPSSGGRHVTIRVTGGVAAHGPAARPGLGLELPEGLTVPWLICTFRSFS